MQETRNNCFGSKERSMTLRQAKTGFGFKVSFRPVNKIKFSSPKDPIPIENYL